jgi:DNA-directed RNA polymerase specialized sigma subunit
MTSTPVDALRNALFRLPYQERLVLSLVYLEGLAERDVAAVLRLSESRVMQIRRHATSLVRRLVGEAGASALHAA